MNTFIKSATHFFSIPLIVITISCSTQEKQTIPSASLQNKEANQIEQFKILDSRASKITFKNEIVSESEAMNCFSFFNIYNGGKQKYLLINFRLVDIYKERK